MEQMVSRENMIIAYSRVKSNQGSSGVDGMTVTQLKGYLQANWSELKEALLAQYLIKGTLKLRIAHFIGNSNEQDFIKSVSYLFNNP